MNYEANGAFARGLIMLELFPEHALAKRLHVPEGMQLENGRGEETKRHGI